MFRNKLWFKVVIYIMLITMLLSTVLFTVSLFY
ncbi:stressosome-associated protein Prli42 [Paenibacillus hexagrammi]|uniref:Stressosome-associated protein Prli42 n=1 Tax=Paenibacillus hexagrammi TaxID=2908839 RepID=A0ABY3SDB0_9BACL|nr:stressosome-associated protein Prli42 [Paenibacillus sp. YPD9-1]UJF31209.1 stressosome-associated protein Prli42 [Paenibacillus sp. YPD9-1]